VLPGVTVEAASPVLIEKARVAVSDGTGQYRITDLQPGTYTITFTLTGFTTIKREGVALTGSGVTTINADMRVGAVTETIVVSGETPVVDVQTTRRQEVLTSDVVQALPATRGYNAIIAMIPSVMTSAFFNAGEQNNTQLSPGMTIFTAHGGRGNEGRVQVDGLNVGAAFNGGGVSGYIMDTAGAQELQFTLSGGLGEAETGGINLNIVPKTGGNKFSGEFFWSAAGDWSETNNVDDQLRGFGITQAGLVSNFDLNGSVGGPIKRDHVWFYANARTFGNQSIVPGAYANKNAGDPTKWTYEEDRSVGLRNASGEILGSVRVTAQLTPRNKVGVFVDQQRQCTGSALAAGADGWCRSRDTDWVALGGLFTSPEADAIAANRSPQRVTQATWTSPLTSKLLLEAGFSSYVSRWGWMETPGSITNLIPVTQFTPTFKTYRGLDNFFYNYQDANVWRASIAYVTGSHNTKFGYQGAYHIEEIDDRMNQNALTYTFIVPAIQLYSLTMRIAPWEISNRTGYHSFYAQDQWTRGRLSLQGALRYDRAYSFHPAEHNGSPVPSRWNPTPISFPRTDGVRGYNDITPRVGVAYDLFGDGKTSLKVNIGKYLESANNQGNYQINNPASDGRNGRFEGSRFQVQTSRTWIDFNGNYNPECELMDPAPNGECISGWDNLSFGKTQGLTTINQDILEGWGVRPWDWQLGASIQREIVPRVSVEVGYHRRWFGNFFVNDNRAVGPNDFDQFSLTAPRDAKLPGGGGYAAPYYDVKTAKFGQVDNYYTFETDYAPARKVYWHGFDTSFNARLRNGLTFQGGTSTGRGVRDTCALWAALPELIAPFNSPFGFPLKTRVDACKVTEPFLTQVRGLAAYEVPKAQVQLSLAFRSVPGTFSSLTNTGTTGSNGFSLNAVYTPTPEEFQASLGRPQSSGFAQYNLLLPGDLYTPRLTYVDVRLAKVLRFQSTRTIVGFDLYNLFNSNTATALNTNYGTTFLQPTAIQSGRLARFNVTFNF
jgi:hypothetical protein